MSELKPCPFCGGENISTNHYHTVYYVMCETCECRGDFYNTEEEAITAWNTRAERTCEIVKGTFAWECDQCHERIFEAVNYCPNCGAKVVE